MKSAILKRAAIIDGRKSGVTLEEPFWDGLEEIARLRDVTRNHLVTKIDRERDQANLSSAIRLFVLEHYRSRAPAE
jgi:predicted DNA-binding ribbon-helix-helix protein